MGCVCDLMMFWTLRTQLFAHVCMQPLMRLYVKCDDSIFSQNMNVVCSTRIPGGT